jgi:hypothetical protein
MCRSNMLIVGISGQENSIASVRSALEQSVSVHDGVDQHAMNAQIRVIIIRDTRSLKVSDVHVHTAESFSRNLVI